MPVFHAPLWPQLLVLWVAGVAPSCALVAIDVLRSGPYKFFWLIPYPSLRLVGPMLANAFRAKPLLATAAFLVPALVLLATLMLVGARVAIFIRASGVR